MPSFLPAAAGGVTGAALCVGALALGGVFDDPEPSVVVRPSAMTETSPAAAVAGSAVAGSPVASRAAAGSLAELYEKTRGAVVEIRAEGGGAREDASPGPRDPRTPRVPGAPGQESPFPDPRDDDGIATGSGFVVGADGTIVTNAHVVGRSRNITVRFDEDDAPIKAALKGSDPSTDIAVLQIDPEAAKERLVVLELAESADARVGDTALAIGNPFGLGGTATAGIISATGRQIEAPNGFSIAGAIQTDAPINPGNSGGPLLDGEGRVLGVNSQILTGGSRGNVGIGFAVPAATVRSVLPDLKAGRTIRRPYLGVSTTEPTRGMGALVADVVAGGPAADAGLRARDTILKVGERTIVKPEDVSAALESAKPGDEVVIAITRGGRARDVTVTLGTRPATVR